MPNDNNKTNLVPDHQQNMADPPNLTTPPPDDQSFQPADSTTDTSLQSPPPQPKTQIINADKPSKTDKTGNVTPQTSPSDALKGNSDTIIATSPHAPQKYGGRKIIATIFGILLLIGGVAAGVILVQRQQQIAERAASGKECAQSPNCILLDEPGNSGTYITEKPIKQVAITAKDVYTYLPGDTNDGCYHVVIDGTYLSWNRVGEGPSCKDVSNVQIKLIEGEPTKTPTPSPSPTPPPGVTTTPPPPSVSAKCLNVKAYDSQWNLLSTDDLKKLTTGSKVRFAVAGEATSGTFDKARFSVNNTTLGETSTKKPGSSEFYVEYTIPMNTKNFSVKGEVHHTDLGWI